MALDGDQSIVAWREPGQVRIARFAATGEVVWSRSFAGQAEIEVIAVDPFHNVVFGGELGTEVDFGGGPLPLLENSDDAEHGFVVELSASGVHVFSTANRMRRVTGIASNGARLVVSGATLSSVFHPRLQAYDAAGTPIPLSGLWDTSFGADNGNCPGRLSQSSTTWWRCTNDSRVTSRTAPRWACARCPGLTVRHAIRISTARATCAIRPRRRAWPTSPATDTVTAPRDGAGVSPTPNALVPLDEA